MTIVEQALELMKAIHAKGDQNGNEIYLLQDLYRFIKNEEDGVGGNLNKLFEPARFDA